MYEHLVKYFNGYATTRLEEKEIELVSSVFIPKRFRKKQFFLQEGEVCRHGAFIVKGAMRKYSVDEKGEEHTIQLLLENWWANDWESMSKGVPSKYFIDAWEETEALLATKENMYQLIRQIPTVTEWSERMRERHFIAEQNRLNAAISLSAEQRYHELEKAYPEFLQRFPQHVIASYLGITKDTLSRIRHKELKK